MKNDFMSIQLETLKLIDLLVQGVEIQYEWATHLSIVMFVILFLYFINLMWISSIERRLNQLLKDQVYLEPVLGTAVHI